MFYLDKSFPPTPGLWVPCDFWVSASFTRRRLLALPTFLAGMHETASRGGRLVYGYVRLELSFIINLCVIIDFRRLLR